MSVAGNLRRIQNEFKLVSTTKDIGLVEIKMVDDNIYDWKFVLAGPENSLYQGYNFEFSMKIPNNYPNSPPDVKFISPILHINVNTNGDICLDLLKDNWSSAQSIIKIIMSLRLLLAEPNIDDPFNSDLLLLYVKDKLEYEQYIRSFCDKNRLK